MARQQPAEASLKMYPLGLAARDTVAVSPLPGHLLAGTGLAGRMAAIALLVTAGVGVAVRVAARPPADVGRRLAWWPAA